MPKTTPEIIKAWVAKIVLFGDSHNDDCPHVKEIVTNKGMSFVHPYDEREVIAGQGG